MGRRHVEHAQWRRAGGMGWWFKNDHYHLRYVIERQLSQAGGDNAELPAEAGPSTLLAALLV